MPNSISNRLNVGASFSPADESEIRASIAFAEAGSSIFDGLASNWLSMNPMNDAVINGSPFGSFAISFSGIIALDFSDIAQGAYINNTGTAVQDSITSVAVHEFVHAFTTLIDLEDFDTNADGIVDDFVNLTDYRGDTVTFSNLIYQQLGIEQQNSYLGISVDGALEAGFDYTNGQFIHRSWVSENQLPMDVWDSSFVGASHDLLISGRFDSELTAGRGNDFLYGLGGDDRLDGGRGRDFLSGGADEDVLLGGSGADILMGGDGFDRLFGDNGNDLLLGADFETRSDPDQVQDFLVGGAGDDLLVASAGGAEMEGGSGNDFMFGGLGDDEFLGGAAQDYIFTGGGADEVRGGAGNDWINAQAAGSQATVYIDADSGRDYIEVGQGGWAANGVEEIIFEGVSSENVTLIADFELVSSLDTPGIVGDGVVFTAYRTEIFRGDAYIRIDGSRASINIGEITLERYSYYDLNPFPGTDGLDGEMFTASFEGNTSLVFDDATLAGGADELMIDYLDSTQALGEEGIRGDLQIEDEGFFQWEDIVMGSTGALDNAPGQFTSRFSSPHVIDDADLYDIDLDLGLIVTEDVTGILI